MTERVIVVQTASGCDRYALPKMGAVTFGSGPQHPLRIDAELALEHAVLFLDESVAIEILDDDSSHARAKDESFRPLKKGQTIELKSGDRVRLGAAELAVVEVEPVVACARVLHKLAFDPYVASRNADASRTSDVIARLRFGSGVASEALHAAVASSLKPGDVVSPLSGNDCAAWLGDVTASNAKRSLGALAAALGGVELSVGLAGAREADALKVCAERLAPVLSADAARVWVSDDPEMRQIDKLVNRAAAGLAHVLLLGETGVGKDVYAQLIHERSRRSAGPFVRVSCVELSETFERDEAAGLLSRARGGTLHIDEITGLSARAQLGLGYALDEAEGTGLDVRFIASSNHDLSAAVEAGQFRKDLFYRLDQLQITVPPLRQRKGDVLPLAELFLAQAGRGNSAQLSDRARAALEEYGWPGNVRELKNTIERALLLAGDAPIGLDHLPRTMRSATPQAEAPVVEGGAQVSLRSEIAALEKRRILEALRKYPTQREAAEALEMPMRTFLNRLDALGIQRARGGGGGKSSDDETT